MPHRKERPSGSSLHAQGSAGTAVRTSRVGWSAAGGCLFALFLSTCSPAALAALPGSCGIQEMTVDWLYDCIFLKQKCS